MVIVPLSAALLWVAEVNETDGAISSSVMVAVWTEVAPFVALVGVPIVTITVSLASSKASPVMVMVAVPVVEPAVIVIGLTVMV